jgi:hypothetical protein
MQLSRLTRLPAPGRKVKWTPSVIFTGWACNSFRASARYLFWSKKTFSFQPSIHMHASLTPHTHGESSSRHRITSSQPRPCHHNVVTTPPAPASVDLFSRRNHRFESNRQITLPQAVQGFSLEKNPLVMPCFCSAPRSALPCSIAGCGPLFPRTAPGRARQLTEFVVQERLNDSWELVPHPPGLTDQRLRTTYQPSRRRDPCVP